MVVGLFVLSLVAVSNPSVTSDDSLQYNSEGRRDPFVSLMRPLEAHVIACPPGLPGYKVSELALKGTVKVKGEYVALLVAPNGKTYFVRKGQPLYDGRIVEIGPGTATVQQDGSEAKDV